MNKLHLFPEADGLQAALRAQSRAVANDPGEPDIVDAASWRRFVEVNEFERQEYDTHITEADCRQTKPAQVSAEPTPVDVWHTEPPTAAGVYIADLAACVRRDPQAATVWKRRWNGASWSAVLNNGVPAFAEDQYPAGEVLWLRLIEADQPQAATVDARPLAEHAAQEGGWVVCVDAPLGGALKVGAVYDARMVPGYAPSRFMPCDRLGRIAHRHGDPCPVPAHVKRIRAHFEAGDNYEFSAGVATQEWWGCRQGADDAIVAWEVLA